MEIVVTPQVYDHEIRTSTALSAWNIMARSASVHVTSPLVGCPRVSPLQHTANRVLRSQSQVTGQAARDQECLDNRCGMLDNRRGTVGTIGVGLSGQSAWECLDKQCGRVGTYAVGVSGQAAWEFRDKQRGSVGTSSVGVSGLTSWECQDKQRVSIWTNVVGVSGQTPWECRHKLREIVLTSDVEMSEQAMYKCLDRRCTNVGRSGVGAMPLKPPQSPG